MHSDPIARPPAAASTSQTRSAWRGVTSLNIKMTRWRNPGPLPALIAMLAIVIVLAGCNTGSMTEARRSQQFDAGEEARLTDKQATRTAETFFAPTATPTPSEPLPPTMESLVVTLGVGPDGAPSGSYLSVPTDAGVVYAAGLLRNVQAGQVVTAAWTDAFGNVYGTFEVELTADAASQWVVMPMQIGGATPGEFAVYFYGGGHQIGSLAFTITGAGSGAQLLPDPPANPQARATSVPRQSSSESNNQGGNNQNSDGNWQQDEGDWQQDNQWDQQQDQWNQQQDQWNQPQQDEWNQQDQWNQGQQDQWNQPAQDQWNQPQQDQWNQGG